MIRLLSGDCRDVLATLPAESVQCVVTSPPYYGLRDYGTALWDGGDAACDHIRPGRERRSFNGHGVDYGRGSFPSSVQSAEPFTDTCGKCGAVRVDRQIGLEATPDEYLATMVGVFREVRRVLRRDGTCWVNMGDSYNAGGKGQRLASAPADRGRAGRVYSGWVASEIDGGRFVNAPGLAPKQLLLMPARLALALQADGWWVRSDVIWCKPNPMPESAKDRPTSAHEHIFLLTKSARYFYDAQAIAEAVQDVRQGSATRSVLSTQERDNGQQLSTMRGASLDSISSHSSGPGKGAGSEYLSGWQGEDSPLFCFPEREGGDHASPRGEASAEEGGHLHADTARMARDQGERGEQVPLLRQEDGPARDGSCDTAKQGRASCGIEHRSSMQELQQQERHSASNPAVRNARNWWVIATSPFSAAHFATFPPELAERCIKAGTSERGCCAACGKPWERVTEKRALSPLIKGDDVPEPDCWKGDMSRPRQRAEDGTFLPRTDEDRRDDPTLRKGARAAVTRMGDGWDVTTTGWAPGCQCDADVVPCRVLDPFIGAGTTALVADRLQRDVIGIDLNTQYTRMAMDRCIADAPLFTSFPPAEDPEEFRMADLFAEAAE